MIYNSKVVFVLLAAVPCTFAQFGIMPVTNGPTAPMKTPAPTIDSAGDPTRAPAQIGIMPVMNDPTPAPKPPKTPAPTIDTTGDPPVTRAPAQIGIMPVMNDPTPEPKPPKTPAPTISNGGGAPAAPVYPIPIIGPGNPTPEPKPTTTTAPDTNPPNLIPLPNIDPVPSTLPPNTSPPNQAVDTNTPDPDNMDLCPLKPPDFSLAPPTCDESALTRDCRYSPVMCEGYPDVTYYETICTCYANELICAQALCLPPPPVESAAVFCTNEKPDEGDACEFKGACKYNARSCQDETDANQIVFDTCKCRGGQFICEMFNIACASDAEPVCPTDQPQSNSKCDIQDLECNYNPFGCPTLLDRPGVFLNTCTCDSGVWVCEESKNNGCPRDEIVDGAADGNAFCFPGDALVQIQTSNNDKMMIPMKQLQIGDMVRVKGSGSQATYEPVYSFGHKNTDGTAEYMELRTSASNKLVLSAQHMLWEVTQDTFIPASEVKPGHQLLYYDQEDRSSTTVVTSVRSTIKMKKGMYAPFTPSGTIVVNNILASNFVAIPTFKQQYYSYQWMAHTGEFPHRAACHYFGSCKDKETYNEDGINQGWCTIPLQIFNWFSSNTTNNNTTTTTIFLQSISTIFVPLILSTFWIIEQVVFANHTAVVGLLLALVLLRTRTTMMK